MTKILFLFLLTFQLSGCSNLTYNSNKHNIRYTSLSISDTKTSATFKQSESNHVVSVTSDDAKQIVLNKDSQAFITSMLLDELNNDVFYTVNLVSNGYSYQMMIDAHSGDVKQWKIIP